ncbi:hypothetical protein [Arthrobacter sp. QXT-31]|uniref:hypothetical protein n=1 Tax=Arthrobacter sp. QXT-31 TaxID=1357915 RepID=UPI0012FA7C55|nr:hypothetical protein [Arthrobacter sp. QXT-31]
MSDHQTAGSTSARHSRPVLGLLIAAGMLAAATLPSKVTANADGKSAAAEVDQTSH